MLDQSHNVTDPIESLMVSAIEVQRAYAQALLVDRRALEAAQNANDVMAGASHFQGGLRNRRVADPGRGAAARTAARSIPVAVYRASNYRAHKAKERPAVAGSSSGIV